MHWQLSAFLFPPSSLCFGRPYFSVLDTHSEESRTLNNEKNNFQQLVIKRNNHAIIVEFHIIIARYYIIQRRGRKFHFCSFPFLACHCKNQHLYFHNSRKYSNSNRIWWNWIDKKNPQRLFFFFFFNLRKMKTYDFTGM